MDKYIYDKSNVLWYELKGDYYFTCRRRKAYRLMGPAALMVYTAT